ncbi:MAG: ABC transporter ATP-binding protein, partial [Bryobacteraceae bacterium]|nr:ABC transporter ATP-binding protein [Bryobacteraceae bacterium]
ALRSADKVWLLPKGGPLLVGTPVELVLNGSFERAFRSEGVDFDPRSGMFRLHKESAGEVEVHGDSLQAIWTARAVERRGYVVVPPGTEADITISVSSNGAAWTFRRKGRESTFHSLEDVLRQLHQ